jgi:hypothetical protein
LSGRLTLLAAWQEVTPYSSRRHPSSFVACALKRFGAQASLRRTSKYASLLRISGALHLGIFEQPEKNDLFSILLSSYASQRISLGRNLGHSRHQYIVLWRRWPKRRIPFLARPCAVLQTAITSTHSPVREAQF